MAKTIDQRAGGFETENTGGVLSGLLAEEEHLDRRAMFRLGTWGVASVGAVVIAVLANQSAIKTRRDEVAALDLTRQSQQIQSVARESQNETRRLASAIDTLNGDRDRLYSRLTSLEQGMDSVTGAIARQNKAAATAPAMPTSATSSAPPPQPVTQSSPTEPAPAVAPVTTTLTPSPESPHVEAKNPAPPANVMAAAAPPAPVTPSSPPAAPSAIPLMASKSLMAPPDAAAGKLMEPGPAAKTAIDAPAASPAPTESTASAPPAAAAPEIAVSNAVSNSAADKVATAEPASSSVAPLAIKRTQFGVDVGGANSVGGLRALWRGLLKSRSNAPLTALQPIIVVKERDTGLGMQLRLVAGPLGDAAAAARICAALAANDRPCETTVFDGQRLALKAEDVPTTAEPFANKPHEANPSRAKSLADQPSPEADMDEKSAAEKPAAAKPGPGKSSHRRGYSASKRVAVEDPPKKPENSSGISSFFSSRIRPQ